MRIENFFLAALMIACAYFAGIGYGRSVACECAETVETGSR